MATTSTNTLYLIRHGENLANITREFSYKLVDYPLTPKGVMQAEQTALYFQEKPIDAIYASPLRRAYQTAEIIAEHHHLPVTILEEFREVNVGDLEMLPPTDANWRMHDQIVDRWVQGFVSESFPGGENFLELIERSRRGLLEVTRGRDQQRIIIAAHGGILAAIGRTFCPNYEQIVTEAIIHNCGIVELELTTSGDDVTGFLQGWGITAHLSGVAAERISYPVVSI